MRIAPGFESPEPGLFWKPPEDVMVMTGWDPRSAVATGLMAGGGRGRRCGRWDVPGRVGGVVQLPQWYRLNLSRFHGTRCAAMSGTYVTDITHFLDDVGELVGEMPSPSRKLASFLVLLIDAVTQTVPARDHDTRIRCRTEACTGSIQASLASPKDLRSLQSCGPRNATVVCWDTIENVLHRIRTSIRD